MTPKTILFATDLSPRCDRALDRATSLAARWHARLIVVHVLPEPTPLTDMPSWRRAPDPRQAAWERVRRDLQGAGGIEIDVVVERGEPASLIPQLIVSLRCDLVVTGMARDETLGRILLGTTVEALVRKTNVPVLVVKSRPRGPYRNVVVATDFSEGSRCALETALALLPEAQISVFHAYGVNFEGLVGDRPAARESAAREAQAAGEAFLAATPAVAAARHPIRAVCEYGEVGAVLQDFIETRGAELAVLGTEGRSGLAGVLLGSVAQRLLAYLAADVLAVRRQRD
ncbi:MAG: hypothetical protein NFCOHLIN_00449 [Gammaproteobacteria bacterium]|nr:hypothetical protein [Gammaproteobacteria bacterium]